MSALQFRLHIERRHRGRDGAFSADLTFRGMVVGKVERGQSQGGRRAKSYRAILRGTCYAEADTLRDLEAEMRDPEIAGDMIAEAESIWWGR